MIKILTSEAHAPLFDLAVRRIAHQLTVRFLEEQFEGLFDPRDHVLVLVEDAALAQEQ